MPLPQLRSSRENNKLSRAAILGLVLAITGSIHAAALFSDGFDTYTNGTADANYTAAYGGISGGPTCVVTNGTGLGGSKSVQAPGTTDMTLIRKNVAIDLTAGAVTNGIFFQRVSAQVAAPQIGLMSELSGALNTVNSVGGRLNQFDQLDVRSSESGTQSSVGTAVAVGVTLTNGNWYNLRTITTKTATTNQLTVVLQLWNSDTNGGVGTLIASNSQTVTNASVWTDTTLYAAVRLNNGNSGVSNLDNFSATQLSTSPTITLTGTLGAVNTTYGTASALPSSFQIAGSDLAGAPGNLMVTPPSGYEVSLTNNTGYSTSLSVPYGSGTLTGTNIYVRLAATTAVGTYSGNVTVAGGGAVAQTIATAASTVSPAAGPPVVTSFTLMYPGTGGPAPGYDPITNNATIDLSLAGTNLSIRANTSPSNDFGSVAFSLTGATSQSQTDNTYPWSLFGDSGGSYTGAVFNVGSHTLTATPYSADNGGGSAGTAATINFTTTNSAVGYPPPGYQLVWADEFNGTNLDTTKWGYENPGKWRDGYNTPTAVSVTNGLLTITTYTENGTNFTCELNTYNKFTPKYGYVEASIDFNDSPGEWSGFWMYDYGVPTVGNPKTNGVESDIIEHLAHNVSDADVSNQGVSTLHWDGYGAQTKAVTSGNYSSGFATGFHTCALLWTPDAYKFIMDGVVVWTTTNAPAQDPVPPASPVSQTNQFLLFSSEVWNSNWVGTISSGGFGSLATSTTKLKVDYVRYYQLAGPTITLSDTLTAVNTTYGTASATPTSFHVSGISLTGNLTVTPPSGYEVSTSSGSGYTTSLTLTPSGGTLASTQVYVRLTATATVAGSPYSGNVTVSGGGATSKTIATVSSTVSRAASIITYGGTILFTYKGAAQTPGIASITGSAGSRTTNYVGTGYASVSAPTNAGNYYVSNTVAADANYNGVTNSQSFSINRTNLTITAQANAKTYDGTTASVTNAAISAGNIQGNDTAPTWTQTYNNKYAGTGKTLTPSSLVVTDGNGGNNYNYTYTPANAGVINKATTTATLAVGNSPATYNGLGQSATVSVTTSNTPGAVANIFTGGQTLRTNAGTYAVTADYVPTDTNFTTLTGLTATNSFIINPAVASVTAVAKSKTYGDVNPLLTAVTNGAVTGDVINVTLATTATQFSSVGVFNVSVTPGSNPNYSVFTTNGTLTINPAGTTMALASDNNPALPGANVTFTATVSSGAGIPTGSVAFRDGLSALGTRSLNGSAQAALGTAALAQGNHTITAEYAGGGNFSGSTNSPALTQGVNPPPPLALVTTGGGLQLSWSAPGYTLQQAAWCTGPWTNLVPPPASPLAITPTNPVAFFRLFWSAP